MKERIIQVFYFDEYGVKRIRTRIRTSLSNEGVEKVFKSMGIMVYDFDERKHVIKPGYLVEELPVEGGAAK